MTNAMSDESLQKVLPDFQTLTEAIYLSLRDLLMGQWMRDGFEDDLAENCLKRCAELNKRIDGFVDITMIGMMMEVIKRSK